MRDLWRLLLKAGLALSFILSAAACDSGHSEGLPPSKTPFDDIFRRAAEASVPPQALEEAQAYFTAHQAQIPNPKYISIVDFSQHSGQKRFFIIDMSNGSVEALLTAHGRGSDPEHTGVAQRFSNISGSRMTSLGFYLTAESYYGEHGLALRMDGLESSNDNARARAIVIHGAAYVDPSRAKMGRSFGCPAVTLDKIRSVVERLMNGSLFYAYHPSLRHQPQNIIKWQFAPIELLPELNEVEGE